MRTENEARTPPTNRARRSIVAWCLYDFANSPFTTVVVTFLYAQYFERSVRAEGDSELGIRMWAMGATVSAIVGALLSPFLGALADRGGFRKLSVGVFTATTIAATTALYFLPLPGSALLAVCVFVVADVSFELGGVFYNAFLPDIASQERIGRVSGYGWALGYLGGLAALVIAFVGFVQPEHPWFGVSKEGGQHVRATLLVVAAWFALFSLPLFLWVKEDRSSSGPRRGALFSSTVRQLRDTFREIRRYRQIVRLLVARVFYNDGIVTIFAFAAIYAAGTFGMSEKETLVLGIVVNLAAGLGAFAMGHLDDILGGKRTIQLSVVGLLVATALAMFGPTKAWLWAGALLVGIFSGPNQSASRSLIGRFVPPDKENEFFGFLAFSGKATAFLGPFLFGQLSSAFHSQRVGIAPIFLFFLVGLVLLATVDEADGIRAAGRDEQPAREPGEPAASPGA
jgi:UMF1 family MFS transporter